MLKFLVNIEGCMVYVKSLTFYQFIVRDVGKIIGYICLLELLISDE